MNFQKIILPVAGVVVIGAAFEAYGWPGVMLVVGVLLMWMLLQYNRLIQILKRAADRPVGYIDSAVMLNAKLKAGFSLLHVIAMTRALGQATSPENQQPEVFRWTDPGGSHVSCEFANGRLTKWELFRPPGAAGGGVDAAP